MEIASALGRSTLEGAINTAIIGASGGTPKRSKFYNTVLVMPVKYTEQQLERWVTEAEQGYDVAELKKRGRGRPGRASEPFQVVTVRLTQAELDSLDKLAAQKHLSRSELLRQAIASLTAA